jgi:hypothetical protein
MGNNTEFIYVIWFVASVVKKLSLPLSKFCSHFSMYLVCRPDRIFRECMLQYV